jgi:hypothetical protein
LIKHPKGDVAQQIRLVGEDNICTIGAYEFALFISIDF